MRSWKPHKTWPNRVPRSASHRQQICPWRVSTPWPSWYIAYTGAGGQQDLMRQAQKTQSRGHETVSCGQNQQVLHGCIVHKGMPAAGYLLQFCSVNQTFPQALDVLQQRDGVPTCYWRACILTNWALHLLLFLGTMA